MYISEANGIALLLEFINPSSESVTLSVGSSVATTFSSALSNGPGSAQLRSLRHARVTKATDQHSVDWRSRLELPPASSLSVPVELTAPPGVGAYQLRISPEMSCEGECVISMRYPTYDFEIRAGEDHLGKMDRLARNAMRAVETGRTAEADAAVDQILQLHPRSAIGYRLRGVIAERRGQPDAARSAYEEAAAMIASGQDTLTLKRLGAAGVDDMLHRLRADAERALRATSR